MGLLGNCRLDSRRAHKLGVKLLLVQDRPNAALQFGSQHHITINEFLAMVASSGTASVALVERLAVAACRGSALPTGVDLSTVASQFNLPESTGLMDMLASSLAQEVISEVTSELSVDASHQV